MIGQLTGIVARIDDDSVILDVQGVGYEVAATSRLLARLEKGQTTTLAIETLVAETFIRLVGFENDTERRTFRLLQTVQGVGAKAALAILHVLPPDELVDAITMENKTAVSKAQGVGPKLAQRVISELSGKTGTIFTTADFHRQAAPAAPTPAAMPAARRDAVSALLNLGFDEADARHAIAALPKNETENVSTLITKALKGLSPS